MLSFQFLLTSLVVVLIPGTGVVYTISTGLFQGRRASLFASLGCTAGIIPHLVACLLGLAAILHTSAMAFQLVKYLGAAYLFYLAWQAWNETGELSFKGASGRTGWRETVTRGFMLNILNPKLSIFFLAFLPQFVTVGNGSPLKQMLVLSLVFMAMTLAVFIVYGLLAHAVRARVLNSPSLLIWMQRSFAGVFAALGAKLAFSER